MTTLRKTWLLPIALCSLAGFSEESQALGTAQSDVISTADVAVSGTVLDEGDPIPGVRLDPKTISARQNHTCALDRGGKAYCWGRGNFAKLGNGEAGANYEELRPVPVATSIKFASISAGKDHTCATAVDGKGYCWGNGVDGRLGNGAARRQSTPVLISPVTD